MATWRHKISLLMMKNISLVCWHSPVKNFQHLKRNFVSLRSHEISYLCNHSKHRKRDNIILRLQNEINVLLSQMEEHDK